jgi:lipopolysaccharide export system protein LptC
MAQIERPILNPRGRGYTRDVSGLIHNIPRYSRFVFFSKYTLGGLSIIMILLIVILPMINADKEGLRLAFSTVGDAKQEAMPVMKNPTFQGVDEDNQPYVVTADSAIQHDENTIIVSNVQGDMLTTGQTWLSVKAKRGTINNTEKWMQLTDDVRLMHQDGYEFRTEYVAIDLNSHLANGNQPVQGFGPMGEIRADGFSWQNDARVLRFTGNVKMRILPHG